MSGYSHSQRLNVLGFLSRQGKLIYHSTIAAITTKVVIEAFDRLVAQMLDNASVHRSKAFRRKELEWMSHRVYLVYLSAYSPELNLIEILWRKIKYEWLPLTAYESFSTLKDYVHKVLSGYGSEYRIIFV